MSTIDDLTEQEQRLIAADFAERVLPLFEAQYPDDDRPRKSIEAARAYARGEITKEQLAAARAAAWAAWAAAGAASDAVWDASDAAGAAARDAEARLAVSESAREAERRYATTMEALIGTLGAERDALAEALRNGVDQYSVPHDGDGHWCAFCGATKDYAVGWAHQEGHDIAHEDGCGWIAMRAALDAESNQEGS